MTKCYLGLGSNLQSPMRQLRLAIKQLQKLPRNTRLTKISDFYFNKPYGVKAQPPYYNAAVEIHTQLSPLKLLHHCQRIELKQRRIRKIKWGARTIDIDILLYGSQSIKHHRLTVPHPQMWQRDFVLRPLQEILDHTLRI